MKNLKKDHQLLKNLHKATALHECKSVCVAYVSPLYFTVTKWICQVCTMETRSDIFLDAVHEIKETNNALSASTETFDSHSTHVALAQECQQTSQFSQAGIMLVRHFSVFKTI